MRQRVCALVSLVVSGAIAACSGMGGKNASPADQDWPVVAGDLASTRYSPLNKITPKNIDSLGAAWHFTFASGNGTGTPIVFNGRMYVTSTDSVTVLNPKTGEVIWTSKLESATSGLYKGVAVGEGLIFIGLGNASVVALKQDTGQQVWSVNIGDPKPEMGQYVSSAPAYIQGLVLTGMANGDVPGVRGRLVALDAKTGKQVWRFNSVPDRGQPGAETWPQDRDDWRPGGGGIWITPSIDTALGLAYISVGNASPQWGGETRPGDNLYTASVVAVDIKTGVMRWHFQVVHHDIWDSDVATPPILFDEMVDGKRRKAIGIISTYGYIFMLDRATGKPIRPVKEQPVPQNPRLFTSPTQPYSVGGDRIGPRCIPADSIPASFKPLCDFDPVDYTIPNAAYPIRTIRAAPMAYSPDTQRFYATGAIWPYWAKRLEDPQTWIQTTVPGFKFTGILAAVGSNNNKLAWEKFVPYRTQENGSGFIATAGGLLFHGNTDGYFDAYDQGTGERLWHFQTGASANWPAATYSIGGEQYVSVMSGNGLWTFKLGGEVAPLPAPPVPPEVSTFVGRAVPTDQITMSQFAASLLNPIKQFDEFAFSPQRARVKGGASVTWTNTGKIPHSATALDGSWTTGTVAPGHTATLKMSKPGIYTYIDSLHPWAYGELTVDP